MSMFSSPSSIVDGLPLPVWLPGHEWTGSGVASTREDTDSTYVTARMQRGIGVWRMEYGVLYFVCGIVCATKVLRMRFWVHEAA